MHDLENPVSNWRLEQLTDGSRSGMASVMSYFDTPADSPDGTRIAFCRYNPRQPVVERTLPGFKTVRRPTNSGDTAMEVCWLDSSSGEITTAAEISLVETHDVFGLQWLPSGEALVFADWDAASESAVIRAVSMATGKCSEYPLRGLGVRKNFMVHPHRNIAVLGVLPTGNSAAALRDQAGVCMLDLDTGQSRMVMTMGCIVDTTPALQGVDPATLMLMHPKWSPDGQRVLFVIRDVESEKTCKILFSMRSDGTELRASSTHPAHMMWHPDSNHILTNCRNKGGEAILALVDVETDQCAVIAHPHPGSGGGSHPSYSPDGRMIALERFTTLSGDGACRLCELRILDTADGSITAIAQFPVINYRHSGIHVHPGWQRDGQAILYNSDQTGQPEIYRIACCSGGARTAG